ncbi:MAG: BrnA antitoxin family protein [Pseudomonas sp.]
MTELQSTDELLEELFGDPKAAAAAARARLAAPAQRREEPRREEVQLQLDPQVLEAFRAAGSDWQKRINLALSTWLAENDPKQMHSA